ncbi:SLATT domain-containing protein [Phytohabitans sp. ZYX-F-186]|uniref:SLATT domain-containing protein n=1 Tax=Phytohabitans maris TaxID=3071409 RepID=A0ABU0ZNM8_9ACTN|nr:SLATT domain-containing protein [Phytohabitans sp. ZYX-F-186]MDQ7908636.1 SLATT domain-containing protein [Phytohabitans sp. ZYX-F-186]
MTAPARGDDLDLPDLPALTWAPGGLRADLAGLRAWAERVAEEAVDWYLAEKRLKSRWSRRLRALAIVLATLGGAVPVAALASRHPEYGNWGYLLLALAAGSVAYDRFFGYSSAWQRYIATATLIQGELADFQVGWAQELAALGDREPTAEEVGELIGRAREFVRRVNEAVRVETDAWRSEFDSRMGELEVGLQGRPPINGG